VATVKDFLSFEAVHTAPAPLNMTQFHKMSMGLVQSYIYATMATTGNVK